MPALSETEPRPTRTTILDASDSELHVTISRTISDEDPTLTSRHDIVSRTADPRGGHLGGTADDMSRNHTPSLSRTQQANTLPKATPQIILARTPLKQKRYGRMEYHPLPPLPPSPPDTPVNPAIGRDGTNKPTINFSRGEIREKSPQPQEDTSVLHLSCVDAYAPPPQLPSAFEHPNHTQSAIPEHERPHSKASKRTVTFADDTTLSSRSSSPDHYNHVPGRSIRQSRSFANNAQIPSSLRLYRSHDSLLATNKALPLNDAKASASRRTAPKDFKHKYPFGQRPSVLMTTSHGLTRPPTSTYNPRLSTSKAQYRGLATLPRPLPSSLRITPPQPCQQSGPRQPPWKSLEHLEEQRERRVDRRERDQARRFRAQTLSQATTVLGSTDSFAMEALKREVEGYRKQVVGVYPDMAFDGNAGKGGRRRCCCVVM